MNAGNPLSREEFEIQAANRFDPSAHQRPAPQLLTYYILGAILTGPGLVFVLPLLWFRYSTLRYRFEEGGLRMQVGFLFRKETVTAYRRIQDIHVTSNVIQRWLGIASISIQTASGSSMPEIVLEGVTEPGPLRDWLYARLRGAHSGESRSVLARSRSGDMTTDGEASNGSSEAGLEMVQLLTEIRDSLAIVAHQKSRGQE